jgi:hypothetical protein
MYQVCGLGYAGTQHVPFPIDFVVSATGYEDAIGKVREFGIEILQCTVKAIG